MNVDCKMMNKELSFNVVIHQSSFKIHHSSSGQRGIRTPVLRRDQIYSLVLLATQPSAQKRFKTSFFRLLIEKPAVRIELTTYGLQNRCSTS
jgi:hypothetical protein